MTAAVYSLMLGGDVNEIMPMTRARVKGYYTDSACSPDQLARIMQIFSPADKPRTMLGSIRFAFEAGGHTLFVDSDGVAELDSKFGNVDVVALEHIKREFRWNKGLSPTPLYTLHIRNETRDPIAFSLRFAPTAKIQRGAELTLEAWGCDLFIDGQLLSAVRVSESIYTGRWVVLRDTMASVKVPGKGQRTISIRSIAAYRSAHSSRLCRLHSNFLRSLLTKLICWGLCISSG